MFCLLYCVVPSEVELTQPMLKFVWGYPLININNSSYKYQTPLAVYHAESVVIHSTSEGVSQNVKKMSHHYRCGVTDIKM